MKFKSIVVSALLPFFVLISISSFANQESLNKSHLVHEVYIKSGLAKQIPALRAQVDTHLNVYKDKLPPEAMEIFAQEVNKIFEPKILEKRIKHNITSSIDNQTILHILKWMNSPLGKRITKLEEKSSTPEETQKMISFIQKKNIKDFPENRVNLFKKLDSEINATDMATDIGIYIGVSVVDILNDMNPESPSYSKEQLKQHIETQRSQIRGEVEKQVLLSCLYIYQSLSDEEISKYLSFMQLNSSRTFNDAIIKSFLRSIYPKSDLS